MRCEAGGDFSDCHRQQAQTRDPQPAPGQHVCRRQTAPSNGAPRRVLGIQVRIDACPPEEAQNRSHVKRRNILVSAAQRPPMHVRQGRRRHGRQDEMQDAPTAAWPIALSPARSACSWSPGGVRQGTDEKRVLDLSHFTPSYVDNNVIHPTSVLTRAVAIEGPSKSYAPRQPCSALVVS